MQVTRKVATEEKFQPTSMADLRRRLEAVEFADYACVESKHYLVFYRSSEEFAERSARVLEGLYRGLRGTFAEWGGFPLQEAEFPLVAVIESDAESYRASRGSSVETRASYDILSNRIHFHEPQGDALNGPDASFSGDRTVLHEGTHQILQNIGVQPRLAEWPLWLSEGLAELAAGGGIDEEGNWSGFGEVHYPHLITLRELDSRPIRYSNFDGLKSFESAPAGARTSSVSRSLLARRTLSPTDYSLVWALARSLSERHRTEFVAYLRELSAMNPLEPYPPDRQEADFVRHFGEASRALDRRIGRDLAALRPRPPVQHAAIFQRELEDGQIQRAAIVSASPSVIAEWLEAEIARSKGSYVWKHTRWRTRGLAILFADNWLNGY